MSVIMITGAARGIGAESARQLHAKGHELALVGLEPQELEARAAELGPRAAAFECDVTDREALAQACKAIVERFGGIDAVVANAGVATVGTVASLDPDEFERVVEVNLLGVYRTVKAALPYVTERRGYVLVVASLAAALHGGMMANYAMAKAGAEAFANSLRQELRPQGVAVGCAYFGFIDTDMVRDAYAHPASQRARRRAPKFLSEPIPVSAAGAAIARGIEERRARVWAPRWVGAALVLRGLLMPALERLEAHDPDATAALDLAAAQPVGVPARGRSDRGAAPDRVGDSGKVA
jgi:NAD(P)-dependent dehydrogenase (short-subunit alcohol dehydrogenase family)